MTFKDNINTKILIISILIIIILYLLYYKINENFLHTTSTTLLGSHIDIDTYTYTGGVEKWIVPDGIYEATFIIVGGNGRNGWGGLKKVVKGGLGAKLTVTIPVIPKQVYDIYVGNNGYGLFTKDVLDYPYPDINNFNHIGHSSIPGNLGSGGYIFHYTIDEGSKNICSNLFNGGSISALFLNGKPIIIAGGGGAGGGAGSWVVNDYKIIEGHNSTAIVKTSKTISNKIQYSQDILNKINDRINYGDLNNCSFSGNNNIWHQQWVKYIIGNCGGGYGEYKTETLSDNISHHARLIANARGPGGTSLVPFRTLYLKQELAEREGTPYISITTKPLSSI
jgi:hypothetical protein